MSRQMTVAIAASRKLDVVPDVILGFLSELPAGSRLLLRSPALEPPARFEQIVAAAAKELWLEHEWVMPDLENPTRSGDRRGVVFERDVAMVGRADVVLALFAEEEMSGGTEHVVEKAIDQGIPVYSYGMRDGRFIRIGEHDPRALWAEQVPKG